MEQLDQASAIEQHETATIVARHQNRQQLPPIYLNGEPCCRDCETLIKHRIEAGIDACRCLECQQWHERKEKRYDRPR